MGGGKPPINFLGNAKRQMEILSPERIQDIKRDKGQFQSKNQIDGKNFNIDYKMSKKAKNSSIKYIGEVSEDDSENLDKYDDDHISFKSPNPRQKGQSFLNKGEQSRDANFGSNILLQITGGVIKS